MMNKLLKDKKNFIAFLTAGDPNYQTTKESIKKLVEAGTDLIEIGVPFSDPCAEGPVIEAADQRALKGGMNLELIFKLIEELRAEGIKTPLVLMTYFNPIFKYGAEDFCKRLQSVGAQGMIIPDMPFEESSQMKEIARDNNLNLISMIAPTSDDRIKAIASEADGFIYLVSSLGVTGVRKEINTNLDGIIQDIREVTDVPICIGFGISTPEQAVKLSKNSDGIIIGSAIVKIMEKEGDKAPEKVYDFAKSITDALRAAF